MYPYGHVMKIENSNSFVVARANKLCLFFFPDSFPFTVRWFHVLFFFFFLLSLCSCIIFLLLIEFFFSAFILMCWQYAHLKKTKIRLKLWYELDCITMPSTLSMKWGAKDMVCKNTTRFWINEKCMYICCIGNSNRKKIHREFKCRWDDVENKKRKKGEKVKSWRYSVYLFKLRKQSCLLSFIAILFHKHLTIYYIKMAQNE